MRPRYQTGQLCVHGSHWVLRYHEDRFKNGKVERVRTTTPLAPYSEYPYKSDENSLKRLRRELDDKINPILARISGEASQSAESTLALGEFIEKRYFPRPDQRLQMPSGTELHIEPSTVKGYKDIWKSM